MKKLFVFLSLAVISTVSMASTRSDAYTLVCKPLYNDSSKVTCMSTIKTFTYFEENSLKLCAAFYNDSNKIACLTNIGDKDFEAYETEQCGSLYNDSAKLECFKANGTLRAKTPACVNRESLLSELIATQDNLHRGEFSTVDSRLSGLINSLYNCQ